MIPMAESQVRYRLEAYRPGTSFYEIHISLEEVRSLIAHRDYDRFTPRFRAWLDDQLAESVRPAPWYVRFFQKVA